MKFDIMNCTLGGYGLWDSMSPELIYIGDIYLYKQSSRNRSYCRNDGLLFGYKTFNYQQITNALCGKTNTEADNGKNFIIKRFIVFEMI